MRAFAAVIGARSAAARFSGVKQIGDAMRYLRGSIEHRALGEMRVFETVAT